MNSHRNRPPHWSQALLANAASRREVHSAFQFFHLKEALFREWHERLIQIPAPPFGEAPRGAALAEIFRAMSHANVATDNEGNVLCTVAGQRSGAAKLFVCAHLDTVFPAETPLKLQRDGDRILLPGSSDNGAGLTAMLAIAASLSSAGIILPCDVVFVGTVGEEGDGNLRGMRALFSSALGQQAGAAIVVDGAGAETAVAQAIGSRRYAIEIAGPGGHSWSDAGRPNPIAALAQAIAAFQQKKLPTEPATSVNFAMIQGGTSVNSIPEQVTCKVDIRSLSQEEMVRQEVLLHRAVEDAVLAVSKDPKQRLRSVIRLTGERPSGALAEDSRLAEMVRVVDRHLQIRTRWRAASTDANIPLSRGIPAVTVGGGGTGGDAHTLDEWFDPTGRELALRRILLLLLTTAELVAEPIEP
jgi:acetylornithine deacetylase/succinyl-diaminopimelate desuccinylase-like protein